MFDDKAFSSCGIMFVGFKLLLQFNQKPIIHTLALAVYLGANVIELAHDPGGSFRFNQVADDFVVEIIDRCPLNSFRHIFILFRF